MKLSFEQSPEYVAWMLAFLKTNASRKLRLLKKQKEVELLVEGESGRRRSGARSWEENLPQSRNIPQQKPPGFNSAAAADSIFLKYHISLKY